MVSAAAVIGTSVLGTPASPASGSNTTWAIQKTNHILIGIQAITVFSQSGAVNSFWELVYNCTLGGSPSWSDVNSAQGSAIIGSPTQSRLFAKPLLLNVLHGGGLIFDSDQELFAKLIAYWISHPVPQGSDEFSAANGLFSPADAATGQCNVQ